MNDRQHDVSTYSEQNITIFFLKKSFGRFKFLEQKKIVFLFLCKVSIFEENRVASIILTFDD